MQTEDATPGKKVELKEVLVDNASLGMTAEEKVPDASVGDAAKVDDVDSSFKKNLEEPFSENVASVSQNLGINE